MKIRVYEQPWRAAMKTLGTGSVGMTIVVVGWSGQKEQTALSKEVRRVMRKGREIMWMVSAPDEARTEAIEKAINERTREDDTVLVIAPGAAAAIAVAKTGRNLIFIGNGVQVDGDKLYEQIRAGADRRAH